MSAFERIEPGTEAWIECEAIHLSRYRFAASDLNARGLHSVLDAACGVGYGSEIIASAGDFDVVGVDRNPGALKIAREKFAHRRVTFVQDDCHVLDAAAKHGPFDAVVSFETIEHLPDAPAYLHACRRVLRAGGIFIVSTPNALVTSPDGVVRWPFHVREYTPDEFAASLGEADFRIDRFYGQRLTPLGQLRKEARMELFALRSNPSVRLGAWLQQVLRGRPAPGPLLPERNEDFEIVAFESPADMSAQGIDGPIVQIAICTAV